MKGRRQRWEPVMLTGREATGGLREYGVAVAGTWDAEVDRVLGSRESAR